MSRSTGAIYAGLTHLFTGAICAGLAEQKFQLIAKTLIKLFVFGWSHLAGMVEPFAPE
jgi:hypothetical protein